MTYLNNKTGVFRKRCYTFEVMSRLISLMRSLHTVYRYPEVYINPV